MNLEDKILLTFKYFDLFEYPLKLEEIFKFGFKMSESLESVKDELGNLISLGQIKKKGEYYFLKGRNELIEIRKERREWSLIKIKKARRISRLLALVPGVKMIAVVSNLGYLNAGRGADIDLFVVTEENKIWSVRFWSALLMKVLKQRPAEGKIRDKICLSHFATENNLNLEKTKIGNLDIHLLYLVAHYLPIYIDNGIWEKFIGDNKWIEEFLPNFSYEEDVLKYKINLKCGCIKKLFSMMHSQKWEKWCKKIQLRIMPKILREMRLINDNKVIVNDGMLKLHSNDKRESINDKINEFIKL